MKSTLDRLERLLEAGGSKKDVLLLTVSGMALILSLTGAAVLPFDAAWIAIVLCGVPILLEAAIGLIRSFDIKADVLVSLALIASCCIGENFAAGEVAFIMQLGALLEDATVAKARAGIEKLVRLTPQTARLLKDGEEAVVPAETVEAGDILRVLPGESIPVDGVILSGKTSINQAIMTGESMPVDKEPGDEVASGTVNQFGAFEMKATRVGEDSSIQRMVRLVRSADAGKAKVVSMADRWATWIVVIALTAAAITWVVSGEIIRAVTILVVFCPCALVLATPTAIMAAIGNATRYGFLVREGDALERLSKVSVMAFDKTGTLTCGTPEVIAVKSTLEEYPDNALLLLAASAEQRSEHPLGKAIAGFYRRTKKSPLSEPSDFEMIPGRGIAAVVDGLPVLAGNMELLAEKNIFVPEEERGTHFIHEGCTVIYLAVHASYAGYIVLSDTLREESNAVTGRITELGISTVLLTGDHKQAAESMAEKLRITEVHSDCLPEDKLSYIDHCQRERRAVCMLGDGINDAPALKRAFVGIAMGGVGSDIAVDAADMVLVNDEIRELPHIILLSRRMMVTITWNMAFSMLLNFVAILLAMTGILNPVVGALVHNAGSVLVILNSALLLTYKKT